MEEKAFQDLQTILKATMEKQEQEYVDKKASARSGFFGAIPENTTSLYIHLSHKIPSLHPYVTELQQKYGVDDVLVTIAPERSGQSFHDNYLDEIAHAEKTKQVITPFEEFSAKKDIGAIIYLCDYVCDGYPNPIFPDEVFTDWHIWQPIRLAEQLQKKLIIGYKNDFCFKGECYEREYITNKEKIKCPVKIVNINNI